MENEGILLEIAGELQYQADKWAEGSQQTLLDNDLEFNAPNDFVSYIAHHSTRWLPGGFVGSYDISTIQAFRTQMIKVAALAVSAIKWSDAVQAMHEETQ
jgi:hypothetical protein